MLKASQRLMKRAALSAESLSRIPASCLGWLATIPTGWPPKRAKQVISVLANFGLMSNHSPSSTISRDHVVHVVGLARGVGDDLHQLLRHAVDRVGGLARAAASARSSAGSRRGSALTVCDAFLVVLHLEVPHPRFAAVDLGAAELLHRDVLAGDGFGQVRAGERHRALAGDHRHEVGERRDVGGAGGAGAHHRRDHRDHARHFDLLAEEVAGAGEERAGRLLDAGAGRVEQPDERHPLGERHLAQAGDLELAGHPHRAGHHGEVVGGDAAGAAVDVAPAGDHAVGGGLDPVHRPLGEVRAAVDAHLDEGALVDQQVDPLAGGELAALVLLGDLLLAAAELRLLAPLVQLLGQLAQRGGARQQVLRSPARVATTVPSTAGRVSRRRR